GWDGGLMIVSVPYIRMRNIRLPRPPVRAGANHQHPAVAQSVVMETWRAAAMIDKMLGVRLEALAGTDEAMCDRTPEESEGVTVGEDGILFIGSPASAVRTEKSAVFKTVAIDFQAHQQVLLRIGVVGHGIIGRPCIRCHINHRFRVFIVRTIPRCG